jgi:hypothetical protein
MTEVRMTPLGTARKNSILYNKIAHNVKEIMYEIIHDCGNNTRFALSRIYSATK